MDSTQRHRKPQYTSPQPPKEGEFPLLRRGRRVRCSGLKAQNILAWGNALRYDNEIAGQARNDGKKGISIKLICLVLSIILIGCYSKKKLDNPNPTSYVFDASIEQIKSAIKNANETYQIRGSLYFSDRENYLYGYIFEDSKNINDAIINLLGSINSKMYFRSGKPLYYQASFHVHLDSISENKTKVEIFTLNPKLYTFGFGVGHFGYTHVKKVPPSTIEEYEILLAIGKQLREKGMPKCNYPRKKPTKNKISK